MQMQAVMNKLDELITVLRRCWKFRHDPAAR
jgi:hypothetical protein